MNEEEKKEFENRTEVLRKKMECDEEYYKEFIKVLENQAHKDKEDIERLEDRVSKYEGGYADMTNSHLCDCPIPDKDKKLLMVDDIKTGLEEDLQRIDDTLKSARGALTDQIPRYKKDVHAVYTGLRETGRRLQKYRGK